MKKIYNYKDGKAYFDNDVKMPISDKEYDLLFMEDGCLCESGNKVYYYLNNLLAPNKFTDAKLTDILTYIREHNVKTIVKTYEEEITITYVYVDGELTYFTNGELETIKGDENFDALLAEMKGVDPELRETIKTNTDMATLETIFNEYDYKRELEVCYDRHSNRILIYKYVAHTKDEEGGDFIADFDLAEFETEFEKKFGYKPEMRKDYDEI